MATNKSIADRDAKRNIGDELLQAIVDIKAGKHGAKYQVEPNDIIKTRIKCGLSQAQFAAALHISPRTLQQWEQGRRQPSGAAETLLKIVARHPEVLREVMAGAY
ncbi:MAG TPA: helix-turn-helix domain-containing protein [Spongiibacteraceae bacterium]|nr:helix-turn-helix domain-containing protein [Spongiibacteraceae bacterium]